MRKPTMSSLRLLKTPAWQARWSVLHPVVPSPREAPEPDRSPGSAGDPELARAYGDAYAAAFGAAAATREGRGYVHTGGYEPPPPPSQPEPDNPARRRRVLAALLVSGLALAVIALLALLPLRRHDESDPGPSATSGGSGAVSPLASLPAGVSIPADGSYIRTRVLASGDLHVDQWIRSRATLTEITLSVPQGPVTVGTMTTSHVVVTGADGPGRVPSGVDVAAATYRLAGAHAVHLSYDMSGAVERSSSAQGRALARVTGLDVRFASRRGPSTASVQGARVLALACSPPRADAAPRPCGAPDPGSTKAWTVQLDGAHRSDRVMAQVDLR